MKIAIVGQGDGAEPSTWSGIPFGLGEALSRIGHDVVHIDANPRAWARRPLVASLRAARTGRVGASHGPEIAALRSARVARLLRASSPDLAIQVNTGFVLPKTVRYATLLDLTVPLALGVGWSDPAMMSPRRAAAWQRREMEVCRRAAACCTASEWAARSVVEDHGVPVARVHAVGFGINAVAEPRPRDWAQPRFLFVGREWERKNGPLVLRAFREVRARHPRATLTLVGGHPPIDEEGVEDLGRLDMATAADRVRLVEAYERSTCFVLPSLMEPFGIVYLEAAAAGIPSIGTAVGGARTAIGEGGTVVDPSDERGLVDAMLAYSDGETARLVGAGARAHAEKYSWEGVAHRLLGTVRS